jgi:hypothetical protein
MLRKCRRRTRCGRSILETRKRTRVTKSLMCIVRLEGLGRWGKRISRRNSRNMKRNRNERMRSSRRGRIQIQKQLKINLTIKMDLIRVYRSQRVVEQYCF